MTVIRRRTLNLWRLQGEVRLGPAIVGFTEATGQEMNAPAGDQSVGEKLFVLQFHEAYHAGQTGLLRRIAGHEGAIKSCDQELILGDAVPASAGSSGTVSPWESVERRRLTLSAEGKKTLVTSFPRRHRH
jgi:hypothetical protein